MSGNTPVASNSLTVRIRLANKPGMLGRIASAIGEAGGDIGAVDVVEVTPREMTRDVTFKPSDQAHGEAVV
jgi:malate dehydrogenase (oxaloacetate-decarboxylating)